MAITTLDPTGEPTTLDHMIETQDDFDHYVNEAKRAMAMGEYGQARTSLLQALDVLDGGPTEPAPALSLVS